MSHERVCVVICLCNYIRCNNWVEAVMSSSLYFVHKCGVVVGTFFFFLLVFFSVWTYACQRFRLCQMWGCTWSVLDSAIVTFRILKFLIFYYVIKMRTEVTEEWVVNKTTATKKVHMPVMNCLPAFERSFETARSSYFSISVSHRCRYSACLHFVLCSCLFFLFFFGWCLCERRKLWWQSFCTLGFFTCRSLSVPWLFVVVFFIPAEVFVYSGLNAVKSFCVMVLHAVVFVDDGFILKSLCIQCPPHPTPGREKLVFQHHGISQHKNRVFVFVQRIMPAEQGNHSAVVCASRINAYSNSLCISVFF